VEEGESGGFILVKKKNFKEIRNCRVILEESVARQHKVVIAKKVLQVQRKSVVKTEPKVKWWRLQEEGCFGTFQEQTSKVLHVIDETIDWLHIGDSIRKFGRNILGISIGWRKDDKETLWWNQEVQKRIAKRNWYLMGNEESKHKYKEINWKTKRKFAKAKPRHMSNYMKS